LYFGSYICLFLSLHIAVFSSAGYDHRITSGPPNRDENAYNRDALWDAAYDRLEKYNRHTKDRSESYASLFEPASLDPEVESINENLNSARQSYFEQEWRGEQAIYRLELWCLMIIAAIVNIVSLYLAIPGRGSRSTIQQWVIILPSMSIAISCFGFATCLRRTRRSAIIQFTSVALSLCISLVSLPVIAVSVDSTVLGQLPEDQALNNASNIFFSTWFLVITSILLVTSWFQATVTTSDWVLFATMSFALMASSLLYFQETETVIAEDGVEIQVPKCVNSTNLLKTSCARVTLGFYLGVVSGVIALIMTPLHRFGLGPIWHVIAGIPFTCAWGFAVAYISFLSDGSRLGGTVYFSSWFSAFLIIDITTMNLVFLVQEHDKRKANEEEENDEHEAQNEGASQLVTPPVTN